MDPCAVRWTVWDVRPARVEQELEQQRAAQAWERGARERAMDARVGHRLDGWLCFEGDAGKRRLAPIPVAWERLSDADLALLCERAARVGQRA